MCVASILKPATGLVEELPVILLFPSNSFVNIPLAVPCALYPSDILLTSPVKVGVGLLVVPETLIEWLCCAFCELCEVAIDLPLSVPLPLSKPLTNSPLRSGKLKVLEPLPVP